MLSKPIWLSNLAWLVLYYTDGYFEARTGAIKHFLFLCFINILCFPVFYSDKELHDYFQYFANILLFLIKLPEDSSCFVLT